MIFMTKFRILILTLLISSCSNFPLYNYGYNVVKENYLSLDSVVVDEEYVKKAKYAFIRVRFGSSRSALLTLLRSKDGVLEWISADDIRLYTYNGKIVKTFGLPNDIEILNFRENYASLKSQKESSYITNFYEPKLLEQVTSIKIQNKGYKKIKNPVQGKAKLTTVLIEEKIFVESINWGRKNKFYFNPENQIEMTTQYLHPFSTPITIEFIKKYTQ